MKITALVLIWTVCSFTGLYKTYCLKKRRDELEAFISAVKNFSTAASYNRLPPSVFFSKIFKNGAFSVLTKENKNPMFAFSNLDKSQTSLTERDLAVLSSFFETVGKSDLKSQMALIENTLFELEKNRSEAANIYNNYAKLYTGAGFLVGTLFIILMI